MMRSRLALAAASLTRLAVGVGLALLAGCGVPEQSAAPQTVAWSPVDGVAASTTRHLIVTVPTADRDALAELAEGLAGDHPLRLVGEWPLGAIDVHCFVFALEGSAQPAETLAALRADPRVRHAQPMQRFDLLSALGDVGAVESLAPLQDGLALMDVPAAHKVTTGGGVRIAIVDTLPDAAHPDLAPSLSLVRDFVDVAPQHEAEAHGTAVAGIIAAEAGSGRGIVGVAPAAETLALRGCWERPDGRGLCSSFTLARALNFALTADVGLINLSIGGPPDPLLEDLLHEAQRRDVLVVAAHGEAASPAFPASLDGVIAVRAGPDRKRPPDRGGGELVAPGRDVLSTAPGAGYDFFTGSSVAAAHATGVAALLRSLRPNSSGETIARALRAGLQSHGQEGTLLNACAAMLALPAPEAARVCATRSAPRRHPRRDG